MSHSPVLFESDDENAECNNDKIVETKINVPAVEPLPAYVLDETRAHNLRSILKGVPPPPNYTNPELDIADLLSKYYENRKILQLANEVTPMETSESSSLPQSNSEKTPSCTVTGVVGESAGHVSDQDKNKFCTFEIPRGFPTYNIFLRKDNSSIGWPKISHMSDFDVYYNLGSVSEELSSLIDKYRERYIGCETGSSFIIRNPMLTGSAKKRARRRAWGGYSPGRRLSHLAQRRRTFSSANLSMYSTNSNGRAILPGALNNNKSAVSKKVIMVDIKSKNSQKSKSASRMKDANRTLLKPSVNQSKRALFQSPDQLTKSSGRKERTSKTTPNKSRISKRALWPSSEKKNRRSAKKVTPKKMVIEDSDEEVGSEGVINANGKRLSSSSDSCQARKKCQKSLNFSCDQNTSINEESTSGQILELATKQQQRQCSQQLSQLHKQKMVWAVASSLKQCGVNTSHELFRPAGTVLFKKCRQVWLHMLNTKKSDVKRSTSEQMFEIAIKYAPETIKKLECGTNSTNSRVSLSTENFVNINSVTCEEKSKSLGFSKVSDIFFSNIKSLPSSQEDVSTQVRDDSESNLSAKASTEIADSDNSLSHVSSELNFCKKDEKSAEINSTEFLNSNTDDSIEKHLRIMFDGCISKSSKLSDPSNSSPMNLPKIFDDDSQIPQFDIILRNATSEKPNLSIDKLSSDSAFNKPINCGQETKNVDHSLRNIVENLKMEVDCFLNENDSGFIDNESGSTAKSCKSLDTKSTKNEVESPTTFTATISKDSSPSIKGKENIPVKCMDICMTPVPSTDNTTFRFKKFGSLTENNEPLAEMDSNDSNKSSVVASVHFDETAMSACDISVNES